MINIIIKYKINEEIRQIIKHINLFLILQICIVFIINLRILNIKGTVLIMCNSVCTLFKLLKQQDASGVFLVYMEGVPGAIRQCIPRTHRRGEVLIMRRLMKRPCHHMGFPVSLVLATSRRQQQWVVSNYIFLYIIYTYI